MLGFGDEARALAGRRLDHPAWIERAADGDIDRGARIQRSQAPRQPLDPGRRREIGFRHDQPVCDNDLLARFGGILERRRSVDGVGHGEHDVDVKFTAERAIGREGLQDRRRVGQARGLNDDANERRHCAALAVENEPTQRDLQLALRRLVFDRERGTAPPFGRVVIETSGLADPAPILQTFSTDRALGGEFHVDVVLTVVDAVTGEANLDSAAEARKQVILADRLVISKTDLAETAAVERLTRRLQKLNPRAAIDIAIAGALDPDRMIAPVSAERGGFVAEAEHSDGITSFVIETDEPIAWQTFSRAMETLVALRGADLLRVKGLLNVVSCRGPVVIQYVQHLAHPPVELEAWPDENRASRVVFITRNIAERQVRDLFAAVRALAGPFPPA